MIIVTVIYFNSVDHFSRQAYEQKHGFAWAPYSNRSQAYMVRMTTHYLQEALCRGEHALGRVEAPLTQIQYRIKYGGPAAANVGDDTGLPLQPA